MSDQAYGFEDFKEYELLGESLHDGTKPVKYERRDWDGTIPDSVAKLVECDPAVRRRFERDSEGLDDPSESGVDMSLASRLAHRGIEPADIEAALRASRAEYGADEKHDGYYERTVGKACASTQERNRAWPYSVRNGALTYAKPTKDGSVEQRLCNFSAKITAEEVRDDGTEQSLIFNIEGSLQHGERLPTIEVPADRFASLQWIVGRWGTRAVVYAGHAVRDHLRCAIQVLSGDAPRTIVYTHLGWRRIKDQWVYLHVGGGIGPDRVLEDVTVTPPEALIRYELPVPPRGDDLREAVRLSLALLELAPDRISIPALGSVYRSVLDSADFSLHFAGRTGAFKTAYAAVLLSHYGSGLDAEHLPGSWSSTGNALEGLAFSAKDALLVVDDFAPHGTTYDVNRQHREADRLLRAQGNRSGRARMRQDGTLRPVKPPRGLILSTGEDVPAGQSLRARFLVLEIGPEDIDQDRLTKAQRDAAGGHYAAALAGFVQWLASHLDSVRAELQASVHRWRERSLSHRRSSDILGHLDGAWHEFLRFATEAGALTSAEVEKLKGRVQIALLEAGHAQTEQQQSADPVERFLRLLTGALVSGQAHIADADTLRRPIESADPSDWGWQASTFSWRPQGGCVGWVRGDDLFLESEAVFAAVQGMASRQGTSLGISPRTLWKRMAERNLLVSREEPRYTTRSLIGGSQKRVIHLSCLAIGLCGLGGQAEAGHAPDSPASPFSPVVGARTSQHDRSGQWRCLEALQVVNRIKVWVHGGPGSKRRWQLRRFDEVLEYDQILKGTDDAFLAEEWIDALKRGDDPSVLSTSTEPDTPDEPVPQDEAE